MKYNWILLIIVLLSILIISGCVQEQPEKYTGPVENITVSNIEEYSTLVWIAEHQGYFTDNGLNVTNKDYSSGKLAAEALLRGEADISISAGFVFVSAAFDNPDLRILGSVALVDNVAVIARKDKEILQPADLKGKTIGATKKSVSEYFLGEFLTLNYIALDEVKVIDLDTKDMGDALLRGEVDAVSTWEPNVFAIKNKLMDNGISWPAQSGEKYSMLILTKEIFITENPEIAERFIQSLIQAEEFVKNNNEDAKRFIAEKYDYEPAYMDKAWPQYNFVVRLDQNLLNMLEDKARWRIKNKLTNATEVPNYFDYIYADALEKVKPEAVAILR